MLSIGVISFKFFRFIQSGLYIDFIFKQISELFIRNFFIYTSLFFGEKYVIEYLTKKSIDNVLFNFNTMFNYLNLDYSYFFTQITSFFLYTLTFINFLIFFFN